MSVATGSLDFEGRFVGSLLSIVDVSEEAEEEEIATIVVEELLINR